MGKKVLFELHSWPRMICVLSVLFMQGSAYPFRAQKAYAKVEPPPPDPHGDYIFNTSGVHHYPTSSTNDCMIPGCIYERAEGQPSDPIWPEWWMSNWTMYVATYDAAGNNTPPWDSPPQGIDPSKLQISSGWSIYDSSYQEGDGALMEYYDKQCLQIFPHPMNWSCAFVSLGPIAYFLRYNDRPINTPECCIFSERNYAARRYFVQHLPYNPDDSTHLNNSLQAYSLRPGGILFAYAFHKNYTNDTYDPTLTPYRHPHSFYFDGAIWPNGFDQDPVNIYVSQNYLDFRAQQPTTSAWDIVNQKCQGELEYCCLFSADCPGRAEEKIIIPSCPSISIEEARTQLINKLVLASQLEHSLMVAYLYASASLKQRPEEFSGKRKYKQFELVRQWRRLINQIAREEMGHLHYATAILVAAGGLPSFGIPDFPHNISIWNNSEEEIIVSLDTFNINTIINFIRYESSDVFLALPNDLKQKISERVANDLYQDRMSKLGLSDDEIQKIINQTTTTTLDDYPFSNFPDHPATVGDFYNEILQLLNCFPTLIGSDTSKIQYPNRKNTGNYAEQTAFEGTPFEEQNIIQEELDNDDENITSSDGFTIPNPDTKRQTFSYVVPNTTIAIQLIQEILLEGEGGGIFVNRSDLIMWLEYKRKIQVMDPITHLYRFLGILGQYYNELKADPNFIPSRNSISNPQIPSTCPNAPPDPYANTIPRLASNITTLPCPDYTNLTIGASLNDIFNRMYNVLCIWLQQSYMHQGPENDMIAIESLMFWLYMSDAIRPVMEILSMLPIGSNILNHTGGSFQQYYRVGLYEGIVVIPEMSGLKTDQEILDAFKTKDSDIRKQQRNSLAQIAVDLKRIEPFIPSLYSTVYHAIIYDIQAMVDEYDARLCYGFGGSGDGFHPNMTVIYPPWGPKEEDRAEESCPMAYQGPDALWNSDYEERSECTQFGGDINGRLLEIKFKGWFQARLSTDPDPPNDINGVTGNAFAFGDEPPMDRAIYFQPVLNSAQPPFRFTAPLRVMDADPVNFDSFGVKVTDIIAYQYPNSGVFPFQHNLSGMAIDQNFTRFLNSELTNCVIDLKPALSPEQLPVFKSDNYLLEALQAGIDPFLLSFSCNGIELARRQVVGPGFEDMTPGQRQFLGRHAGDLNLYSSDIQKEIGFSKQQLPWRYWSERISILQNKLHKLQPFDDTDPNQIKLIERILDISRPMPTELVDADEFVIQILNELEEWKILIESGENCNEYQNILVQLQQLGNETSFLAKSCNIKNNFLCTGFNPPPSPPDSNTLKDTSAAFCLDPSNDQKRISFENAYQMYYNWVDNIVQNGTNGGWDIRFIRLGIYLGYRHSISGNITHNNEFDTLLHSWNYSLDYTNRINVNKNQTCYRGINNRWGIHYDMGMFDTDLLWGWTNGSLWIPIKSLNSILKVNAASSQFHHFLVSWLFLSALIPYLIFT